MDAFWPGPLTMILKRAGHVSDLVTGGQDTIGVRVPNLSSIGGDVKYNPIRSKSFDLAVMPGLQWFSIKSSSSVNGTESSSSVNAIYLHLPVLLGINLGDSATLVLSPGITYTSIGGTAAPPPKACQT